MSYIVKYQSKENEAYHLIIEDDSRVAYAYLFYNDEIVGDVWLYNTLNIIDESNTLPYVNPDEFVIDANDFIPPNESDAISVEWVYDSRGKLSNLLIYVYGEMHASLTEGEKPGCCILAKKDGPLAKTMEGNNEYQ